MAKNKKVDGNDAGGNFPNKFAKRLPTGWSDGADSMANEDLEKTIVASRGMISDIEKDMDNDAKLSVLREDVKALSGAYKDSQQMEDAKVRYCLYLLRNRGAR